MTKTCLHHHNVDNTNDDDDGGGGDGGWDDDDDDVTYLRKLTIWCLWDEYNPDKNLFLKITF